MSLEQWANSGWLRPHQTRPEEIQDLLAIVKRDLADATGNISADWRPHCPPTALRRRE